MQRDCDLAATIAGVLYIRCPMGCSCFFPSRLTATKKHGHDFRAGVTRDIEVITNRWANIGFVSHTSAVKAILETRIRGKQACANAPWRSTVATHTASSSNDPCPADDRREARLDIIKQACANAPWRVARQAASTGPAADAAADQCAADLPAAARPPPAADPPPADPQVDCVSSLKRHKYQRASVGSPEFWKLDFMSCRTNREVCVLFCHVGTLNMCYKILKCMSDPQAEIGAISYRWPPSQCPVCTKC